MQFRTQLNIDKSTINIEHEDKIALFGSCFSDNIGSKLKYSGFNVLVNPFGTVYNPISISKLMRYVSGESTVSQDDIQNVRGIWNHPDFHSDMSGLSRSECYENIDKAMKITKNFLQNTKYIFITLGTANAYWDKDSGLIVSNCHKRPANDFAKVNIDIEQGQKSLMNLITTCENQGVSKKYIFTVSPVRHIKDGIIENSRSKARLTNMIENITDLLGDKAFYFPSFEWMIDDLRDYRFYEKDMIHPAEMAIDYIWDKFINHFMTDETKLIINEVTTIRKALDHKPFNPASEEHITFITNLEQKAANLKKKMPWLSW